MTILNRDNFKKIFLYGALMLGVIVAVWMSSYVPNADWFATFDPAARGLFQGRLPYEQHFVLTPPWAILVLVPFVLFPPNIARGLVLVASLSILIYAGWRLHAPKIAMIALLISPTAIGSLLSGNLDAFVLTGIFLPPMLGLFVLLIKPQVGIGVAIYYFTQTWQSNKWIGIILTFSPIILAFIISGILFPVWINRMISKPLDVWNRSIFPYGIPLGLSFLWLAVKRRNVFFALAAAPFLSPYLTFYTYLMVQIGLLHEDVEKVIRRDVLQIFLCVFLWTIMLIFRL
jgi:hypothetical protein